MARTKSPILTEGELRIMNVLWKAGPSTVKRVVDSLPAELDLAYTTILTTLQNMEKKGGVSHKEKGRAYEYHAVVKQSEAQRSAIKYIVNRFFNDSPEQLVLNVIENEEIDPEVVQRLNSLLDESDT